MISKRALLLTAGIVGSSLVMPAATADVAGCTATFVAAASNPSSANDPVDVNIKDLGEGIHIYPEQAFGLVVDYANHEAAAATAYANCI